MDQVWRKKYWLEGEWRQKKMPETAKKQERRKEGTWEKVHHTNHIEIEHMLLCSLGDEW